MPRASARAACLRELADGIGMQLSRRYGVEVTSAGRAIGQAAADLAKMYEHLNDERIEDLCAFLAESHGVDLPGAYLATWAIDPDANVYPAYHWGLRVPDFHIAWEDGDTLVWDADRERTPERQHGYVLNPGLELEVLLIEDEERLQKATSRMIKKIFPDAKIYIADNAEAAIADLKHHAIKLVVSDYDLLGDGTGGDVFAWVKQHLPHLVDRYVFFTGNDAAERLHYRYLQKGAVTAEDLREVIWRQAPGMAEAPAQDRPRAAAREARDLRPARYARRGGGTAAPAPAIAAPWTDDQLAQHIMHAASEIRTPPGRFGDRKVFLWSIWNALSPISPTPLSLEDFKRRAARLNQEGKIELARADYVAAMPPEMVAQSEYRASGTTYHFVVAPPGVQASGAGPALLAPVPTPPAPASRPSWRASTQEERDLAMEMNDTELMRRMRATLPQVGPEGHHGDQGEVLVAALWDRLALAPSFGIPLAEFKRRLVDLNRDQKINLTRADLTDGMDPDMVSRSQILSLGSRFHFVEVPRGRAAAAPAATPDASGDQALANAIHAAIRTIPLGDPRRWFRDKVYVSGLWDTLNRSGAIRGMSLEEFKRRLVWLNREGLVELGRLDLSGAADWGMMGPSEILDKGAIFHLVLDRDHRGRHA